MIGSVMCVCGSTITFWRTEEIRYVGDGGTYTVLTAKHINFSEPQRAVMQYSYPKNDTFTNQELAEFFCNRIAIACPVGSECRDFWFNIATAVGKI